MGNPRSAAEIFFKESRHARHLSDKLLIEFHQACDNNKPEVALRFLDAFESTIRNQSLPKSVERHKLVGVLIAAHERLWSITHPTDLLTGELSSTERSIH